ncbi:MAG TPA: aldehyde dehydrogenase family protein [Chthoniobacterales bacterium]
MISSAMPIGTGYDARADDSRTTGELPVNQLLIQARTAQAKWALVPTEKRIYLVRRFRELLAECAPALCKMTSRMQNRPECEILTSEIFPLIAACKFLERKAVSILAPQRLGKSGLPLWLHGVASEIHRDPFGVVLIIGPANYSLSLPGIQLLQALVSGNAVLLKPGLDGTSSACSLLGLFDAAGLSSGLATLLPESIEAAQTAISAGVDRVLFTGSAKVGAKILAELAPQLVPATMELSGCDALLVRVDGDLELVKRSLQFSLNLNSGATCIAPHRIFVAESKAAELENLLAVHFRGQPHWRLAASVANRVRPALQDALARGAHIICGAIEEDESIVAPIILGGVSPDCRLFRTDIFAPLIGTLRVKDDEEAVRRINDCPYALGASIFSANEAIARDISTRLRVGFITINDVIVPAADPRVPIGGRGRSGFGSTRGREGLLDLTFPKVVTVRRGRFRPHLDGNAEKNSELLYAYLKLAYAGRLRSRWNALSTLTQRLLKGNSFLRRP